MPLPDQLYLARLGKSPRARFRPTTPLSFRHYFVTIVLRASGNLKVAQARHTRISTTSLYAHLADDELDKAYWETFEKG